MENKINPSRYWFYVTWVNENITPSKGYRVYKVGDIYGYNNLHQAYLVDNKGEFIQESEYHHREIIPNIVKGEPWGETLKKIEKFKQSRKRRDK